MTTSSGVVSVIIDDTNEAFQYDELDTWQRVDMTGMYFNTSHVAQFIETNRGDVLNYVQILFEGASLALVGTTAPRNFENPASETFSVIIDGVLQPFNSTYGDVSPPSYRQWYKSPELFLGPHNITLLNVLGASIDYGIVTHGNNSVVLSGQKIIVDSADPQVAYGNPGWEASAATFNGTGAGSITPYGNSTQVTTTVGDAFMLTFDGGTDLTVYGVHDPTRVGELSLEYSIDGTLLRRVDFTNTGSAAPSTNISTVPQANFPFFTVPALLTLGTHTLTVVVVECAGNQTFVFDYATYTYPLLDAGAGPVLPPSATPVHAGKSRVGAIVGGVVGGVVLLLLVGLLLDCVRRRRRQVRMRFDYPFIHKSHRATVIPLQSVLPPRGDVKDPFDLEAK